MKKSSSGRGIGWFFGFFWSALIFGFDAGIGYFAYQNFRSNSSRDDRHCDRQSDGRFPR